MNLVYRAQKVILILCMKLFHSMEFATCGTQRALVFRLGMLSLWEPRAGLAFHHTILDDVKQEAGAWL